LNPETPNADRWFVELINGNRPGTRKICRAVRKQLRPLKDELEALLKSQES
jgi:hypothetical protein